MNDKNLYRGIGEIDDDILERSEKITVGRKKPAWLKWGAMAACLCLVVAGAVSVLTPGSDEKPVLQWSSGFEPADYFTYGRDYDGPSSSKSVADSAVSYAEERSFSDDRSQMELDGAIPVLEDHPLFDCFARYNDDGSIFSVTFAWHQRGDTYSDLSITAGMQEVELIQDCIVIELDDEGNIVPPAVTVTERDGIQIVAEGNEHRDKTITFQNESGWYQITGSWGDSYAAVVELLDWVWEHPIDLERFPVEEGDQFTYERLEDHPGAFAGLLPDFEVFGYLMGENVLSLKNGAPVAFEGHFYSGLDAEVLESGDFYDKTGWTEIHWCIDTEPDYYDLQESMGDLTDLTEQMAADRLTAASSVSFMMDGCFVKIYVKSAAELWPVLRSLAE